MSRVIRNTFFTVVALVMTTVGLNWNKDIARQQDPVAISQAVLASQLTEADTAPQDVLLPLEVDISRPVIRLGQIQVVTINTVPGAELDIVTQYPNGSVNNSQTQRVVAGDDGRYVQRYRLDNFRHLGVFHVTILSSTPNRSASVNQKFVLQTWAKNQPGLAEEVTGYKYPLIP